MPKKQSHLIVNNTPQFQKKAIAFFKKFGHMAAAAADDGPATVVDGERRIRGVRERVQLRVDFTVNDHAHACQGVDW